MLLRLVVHFCRGRRVGKYSRDQRLQNWSVTVFAANVHGHSERPFRKHLVLESPNQFEAKDGLEQWRS